MKNPIEKLFNKVAKTYDILKHFLTFGLDLIEPKKAAQGLVEKCSLMSAAGQVILR